MADYPLSITGAEIDSALGKVHSADTTPTNGSTDMVTSGGVYTAINNLSLANLAGSALVTESEGIASNDNDTTIPTSAAVKDYVDTSIGAGDNTPFNRLRIKLFPTDFIRVTDLQLQGNGAMLDLDATGFGNFSRYASCDIPDGYRAVSVTVTGDDTSFGAYEGNLSGATSATLLGSGNATNPSSPLTVTFSSPVVATDTNYITIGISDGGSSGRFFGCYVTIEAV